MFKKILKRLSIVVVVLTLFSFFVLLESGELKYWVNSNTPQIVSKENVAYEENFKKQSIHKTPTELATSKHLVTFFVDGEEVYSEFVSTNETVPFYTPENKNNYLFIGWSLQEKPTINEIFNFSTTVTKDLNLYSVFIFDLQKVTETIVKETIKTNIKIEATCYNSFLGIPYEGIVRTGSGTIFSKNEKGYYFVLTNDHVIRKEEGYKRVKYKVFDYLGNEYTAYYKHSAEEYDLGVLYFKANSSIKLKEVSLTNKNPESKQDVVCLSSPGGQMNAYTFGKLQNYIKNSTKDSKIKFAVIRHTAYTTQGSSGGALLDSNLNLIGLNFAGNFNSINNTKYGFAIPVDKINEYLNNYIFNK